MVHSYDTSQRYIARYTAIMHTYMTHVNQLSALQGTYLILFGWLSVLVGTCFDFGICKLKLFASKNRLSIVPSLQNIHFIHLLTILMPKIVTSSNKHRKSILTGATLLPHTGVIKLHHYHGPKCFKMISFCRCLFWVFCSIVSFFGSTGRVKPFKI